MASTYPVPGYRTPRARSYNAATGFQSLPPNLTPANDNTPPWVGRPANDNRKSIRKPARLFNVGGRLLTAAVANHPAVRAARLAWQLGRFLDEPTVGRSVGTERALRQGTDWSACWADCGPHPTRDNIETYGFSHDTASSCNGVYQCLNNQAGLVGHTINEGDPVPSTARSMFYAQQHRYIGGNKWRYRQVITRQEATSDVFPWWFPVRFPMTQPQSAPMPLPWSVLPRQVNSPNRQAGYTEAPGRAPVPAQAPSPRHRPPGPGVKERKITLMSGGALRNLIEAAFEGTEWVGIAHSALPRDCQAGRYSTVAQKFAAVYRCADQLNMCKLIEGVVNNYIEDQIIGQLGNASAGAGRSIGKATGGLGWSRPAFRKSEIWIPKISICG